MPGGGTSRTQSVARSNQPVRRSRACTPVRLVAAGYVVGVGSETSLAVMAQAGGVRLLDRDDHLRDQLQGFFVAGPPVPSFSDRNSPIRYFAHIASLTPKNVVAP